MKETTRTLEKVGGVVGLVVVLLIVAFLGLLMLAGNPWLLQFAWALAVGWVSHAWRTIPAALDGWSGMILPVLAFGLFLVLLNRTISGWRPSGAAANAWPFRRTLAASSLLLCGCAAAIALSGIVHQAVWLGQTPWLRSNMRSQAMKDLTNMRNLYYVMLELETERGRPVDSVAELAAVAEKEWRSFYDEFDEMPILLAPGQALEALDGGPVLALPTERSDGEPAMLVTFATGISKLLTLQEFDQLVRPLDEDE